MLFFASESRTMDGWQTHAAPSTDPSVEASWQLTVILPAYQLLNLTGRYRIDRHLDAVGSIGNVFNRNYSEVYGYNTPGRTLFVGLNYRQ